MWRQESGGTGKLRFGCFRGSGVLQRQEVEMN